jgi:hypothetical protein
VVLDTGHRDPSPVVGLLEQDPQRVAALLELLRLRFPQDLVGLCFDADPGFAVVRVAGPTPDIEVVWGISGALRAVLRLQRPHLFGPPEASTYVVPQGGQAALAVRRTGRAFTPADRRYVDLLALHVR